MRRAPHRAPLWLLAAAVTTTTSVVAADTEREVEHWLDRMARAVETLDYRGTLVHVRGDRVDTLQVAHRVDEQGIRERIVAVDGERREIIRNGNRLRCLVPGDQPTVLESQLASRLLPHLPVDRLTSPQSAYRMYLDENQRVAGLQAQIVEIEPRDEYRYGYRLWLEKQTGMLLRSALIGESGHPIQQVSFTSIEMGVNISDAELQPEFDASEARVVTTTVDGDPGSLFGKSRRPTVNPRVPEGFRLANFGYGRGEDDTVFEHLFYSDGLATFSIYVEPVGSRSARGSRVEAIGPVHVFTTRVGGRIFTVVGEVPRETVAYVGGQFQRQRSSGARPRH